MTTKDTKTTALKATSSDKKEFCQNLNKIDVICYSEADIKQLKKDKVELLIQENRELYSNFLNKYNLK